MDDTTCSECGIGAVYNKKKALCQKCYGRYYAKKNSARIAQYQKTYRQKMDAFKSSKEICDITVKLNHRSMLLLNDNEAEFVGNFFKSDDEWVHHPCSFRLGNMSYTPDFYDKRRNVFIEVSGTRQAYHQNKVKYMLLEREFPAVHFEIRKTNGILLRTTGKRKNWFKYFPQNNEIGC